MPAAAENEMDDGLDDGPEVGAGGGDIVMEVLGEPTDPRLRTPEGRADVAIQIALEFAEVRLSMPEMIYHMDLEAHLLQGSERARLIAGLCEEPTEEQIARIARHLAVIRFLQNCHDRPAEAAEHFQKIARRRQNG